MDGKSFLDTARFLRDNGTQEPDYRSAVSRAYYACFLEFIRVIYNACPMEWQAKGCPAAMHLKHNLVRKCLVDSTDLNVRQLGRNFDSLLGKRVFADYEMNGAFGKTDAEDAINQAEALLTDFSVIGPALILETARYAVALFHYT